MLNSPKKISKIQIEGLKSNVFEKRCFFGYIPPLFDSRKTLGSQPRLSPQNDHPYGSLLKLVGAWWLHLLRALTPRSAHHSPSSTIMVECWLRMARGGCGAPPLAARPATRPRTLTAHLSFAYISLISNLTARAHTDFPKI